MSELVIWVVAIGFCIFVVGQIGLTLKDGKFEDRILVGVAAAFWPMVISGCAAFGLLWILFYALPLWVQGQLQAARLRKISARPSVVLINVNPYRAPPPTCEKCGRVLP